MKVAQHEVLGGVPKKRPVTGGTIERLFTLVKPHTGGSGAKTFLSSSGGTDIAFCTISQHFVLGFYFH